MAHTLDWLLSSHVSLFVIGVHTLCGWGQADSGNSWKACLGVGPKEHGVRPAEERVQSQVPDTCH